MTWMRRTWMRWTALGALAVSAAFTSGCAVDKDEIRSWYELSKKTSCFPERGVIKLREVVLHDKFRWDLRIEAVMGLVRTLPVKGNWMGKKYLIDGYKDELKDEKGALFLLDRGSRERILVTGDDAASKTPSVAAQLIEGMRNPAGDAPAIAYKDAAYGILLNGLIEDDKAKDQLVDALTEYVLSHSPLGDPLEHYPTQKLLEMLQKAAQARGKDKDPKCAANPVVCENPSIANLPGLVTVKETLSASAQPVDKFAALVGEFGDAATRQKMRDQLIAIAQQNESEAQLDNYAARIAKRNADANITQTPQEVREGARVKRDEMQEVLFAWMQTKGIAGGSLVDYLVNFAANADYTTKADAAPRAGEEKKDRDARLAIDLKKPSKLRANALQAIGELFSKNPDDTSAAQAVSFDHVKKLVRLVKDENIKEDDVSVRNIAGEMLQQVPPEQVFDVPPPGRDGRDWVIDSGKKPAKEVLFAEMVDVGKNAKKWETRYLTNQIALSFVDKAADVDKLLLALPQRPDQPLGRMEAVTLATKIFKLDEKKRPADFPQKYLTIKEAAAWKDKDPKDANYGPIGAKLVALSTFIEKEKTPDVLKILKPFLDDTTPVPKCPNCGWLCVITKDPPPKDPKEATEEGKKIETVADFTKYCVLPKPDKADKTDDKPGTKPDNKPENK